MQLFGVDPDGDRRRIRALRATPVGVANTEPDRRDVFCAALEQFDELLTAAEAVGPAVSPIPLYYALNQAGRAMAAALIPRGRNWEAKGHGLSVGDPPSDGFLGGVAVVPKEASKKRPPRDSLFLLGQATRSPILSKPTTVSQLWAAIPMLQRPGLGAGAPTALRVDVMSPARDPTKGLLEPLPGLPAEGGEDALQDFLLTAYGQTADEVDILSLEAEGNPVDGPRALLHWKHADGTSRRVYEATATYLGDRNSRWLIPKINESDAPPPLTLWWCLLLALSSLSRYHPAAWSAALAPDSSRLAVPIEEMLATAAAVIPRLVLLALVPGAAR